MTKKTEMVEKIEALYDSAMPTQTYCFPEYGISVEATNIEEARIKFKQLLEERK
jgi:hypothetical protein